MSFRSYLIFMTLGTVSAWITWILVLHGVDPVRSGLLGFILFYITLTMSIFGTLAILGLGFRLWRQSGELSSRLTLRSFRQAIVLTLLFVSSLLLFSQGWFRWWSMLLLVIIAGLIEMTFISSRRS
jgi:hypothetical protein